MSDSSSPAPSTRLGPTAIIVASVALVIMWSSGFVGAEFAARADGEPVTVLAWRFTVLAGILTAAMLVARRRWPRWRSWLRQGAIALLSQAGYLLMVFEGVRLGVDGGTVALIAALQPMLVATMAGRFLGERANGWMWAGMVVGLAGVGLVVSGQIGETGAPLWAHLLPLIGVLCLGTGTVLQRRWHMHDDLLQTLTIQSIIAAAAFMLVALVRGQAAIPASLEIWGAILWLVFFASLGGYLLYVTVTRSHGATFVSTMLYLTPPTTMLWVWLFFGVPVSVLGLLGMVVAALGVAIVLIAQRKKGDRTPPHDPETIADDA